MRARFLKGKKADIPVTILVLGVFVVCALAIISFVIFENKQKTDPLGIELFEEIHADVEKFYFYNHTVFSREEAAEQIGAELNGNQLTIERNKTIKERHWFKREDKKIISVKYVKTLE